MEYSKSQFLVNVFDFHQQYHRGFNRYNTIVMLTDAALVIMEILKTLDPSSNEYHYNRKNASQMMTEFLNEMRSIFRGSNQLSTLNNTANASSALNKALNEIYTTITAANIHRVRATAVVPSYLFREVLHEGFLFVGFSLVENRQLYYCRLCRDAIYLFNSPNTPKNNKAYQSPAQKTPLRQNEKSSMFDCAQYSELSLCIPLHHSVIQRSAAADVHTYTLEIYSGNGEMTPVILFSDAEHRFDLSEVHADNNSQKSSPVRSKPTSQFDYSSSFFLTSPGRLPSQSLQFTTANNGNTPSQPRNLVYHYRAPCAVQFHRMISLQMVITARNTQEENSLLAMYESSAEKKSTTNVKSNSTADISLDYHQLETWFDCIETCAWRLREENLLDDENALCENDYDFKQLHAEANRQSEALNENKDNTNDSNHKDNTSAENKDKESTDASTNIELLQKPIVRI